MVMVCFFSFLFFLLITDKGAFGSYLKELSNEARAKIERHLEAREKMIKELSQSLSHREKNLRQMLLKGCYDTSRDTMLAQERLVKKLTRVNITKQTKYRLEGVVIVTKALEKEIKQYLTKDLLSEYKIKPKWAKRRIL